MIYTSVNGVLFAIIVLLLCVYRMDYFHRIDDQRVQVELARQDRKYQRDILKHGITTKEKQAREEARDMEVQKYVKDTKELGDRLQQAL